VARRLVDDELWAAVEPLLPSRGPGPKGGKPPVEDRDRYPGLLRQDAAQLPAAVAAGARVWQAMHRAMLAGLRAAGVVDPVAGDRRLRPCDVRWKKRGPVPWNAGKTGASTTWRPTPAGRR
jgi:transposase